ncbi:MAG: DUF4339 domain-containing protein [Tepidisphaeraceae bacterium]
MAQWYFARNGQQQGPISEETIRSMIAAGQLGGDEVVWRDGMAQWTPLSRVPEFATSIQPEATTNPSLTATPAAAPVAYASPFAHGQTTMLTERALDMLRKTKPWARFLSILIFVCAGFMVLAGIVMLGVGVLGANMNYSRAGNDSLGVIVGGIVYIGLAVIYYVPGVYLGRYASRIADLCQARREDQLEEALEAQKSFWKFVGIAALLTIGLWVVMMVIFVLIAVVGAASQSSSSSPTAFPVCR